MSRTSSVWVAQAEEKIVGFVAVVLHRQRRLGKIYMIAVDPGYQNERIGTHLTTFALDRMRDAGMTVAMVETGGDPGPRGQLD